MLRLWIQRRIKPSKEVQLPYEKNETKNMCMLCELKKMENKSESDTLISSQYRHEQSFIFYQR